MASTARDNVSYRLMQRFSNLVICSRCLRNGVVTPVPQLISEQGTLTNECAKCRDRHRAQQRKPATVTWLPGATR